MSRWLLIPMETKVRELHAKLLLGAFAARAGFQVVIGEQRELKSQMPVLPRGIVLEKGATPHQLPAIEKAVSLGNRVVAWCEEGLVYRNAEAYLRDRIHLPTMSQLERFFLWGGEQKRTILTKTPESESKLVLTGNPRFDLLRPEMRAVFEDDARRLRERHGSFILIATNFARANHFCGRDYAMAQLRGKGSFATPELAAFTDGWTTFVENMYASFRQMIPLLARTLPDTNFVVRPHPSENHDAWREHLAGCTNVKVVHEGNVAPWIRASSGLIHNGCTTGVEAYLADIPVLAYRPLRSETYDSKLPNGLSLQTDTADELIGRVRELVQSGTMQEQPEQLTQRKVLASRYLVGLQGQLATDKITSDLARIEVDSGPEKASLSTRVRTRAVNTFQAAKVAAASAAGRVVVPQSYMRHKFSELTGGEVQALLEQFAALRPELAGLRAGPMPPLRNGYRVFAR